MIMDAEMWKPKGLIWLAILVFWKARTENLLSIKIWLFVFILDLILVCIVDVNLEFDLTLNVFFYLFWKWFVVLKFWGEML